YSNSPCKFCKCLIRSNRHLHLRFVHERTIDILVGMRVLCGLQGESFGPGPCLEFINLNTYESVLWFEYSGMVCVDLSILKPVKAAISVVSFDSRHFVIILVKKYYA